MYCVCVEGGGEGQMAFTREVSYSVYISPVMMAFAERAAGGSHHNVCPIEC